MDWITDRIAIGDIEDAMDAARLRAAGVTGVLTLNGFPQAPRGPGLAWVNATLIDGPGNSLADVRAAVRSLRDLARAHRVLVHRAEGLSRSALVVACYLAEQRAIPLEDAVTYVQRFRVRADIDRALLALVEGRWPPPRDAGGGADRADGARQLY